MQTVDPGTGLVAFQGWGRRDALDRFHPKTENRSGFIAPFSCWRCHQHQPGSSWVRMVLHHLFQQRLYSGQLFSAAQRHPALRKFWRVLVAMIVFQSCSTPDAWTVNATDHILFRAKKSLARKLAFTPLGRRRLVAQTGCADWRQDGVALNACFRQSLSVPSALKRQCCKACSRHGHP